MYTCIYIYNIVSLNDWNSKNTYVWFDSCCTGWRWQRHADRRGELKVYLLFPVLLDKTKSHFKRFWKMESPILWCVCFPKCGFHKMGRDMRLDIGYKTPQNVVTRIHGMQRADVCATQGLHRWPKPPRGETLHTDTKLCTERFHSSLLGLLLITCLALNAKQKDWIV